MYKLMVVAGPNRGAAYSVSDAGETSIGRQSGNSVVLQSGRVSKRHCVLVASNGELLVRDQGSSNGTFVNGVLTKEKPVKSGDRISVGEFVFEVVESRPAQRNLPAAQPGIGGNVLAFPSAALPSQGIGGASASLGAGIGAADALGAPPAPKSLKDKAMHGFDHFVMPFFYGMAMKNEWRLICVGVFAAFCVANMFVSISPLLESTRQSVIRECARRADFMARQLADQNAPLLAARTEARVNLGSVDGADGVKFAAVTDLDSRIIAPSSRQNQYLTSGAEALFARKASAVFQAGRETGVMSEVNSSTVTAIEPLKAYNQATGRNVAIGMAVVSVDTSLATMGFGDIGLVYSETLIITALIGAFVLFILYRLTLKPLQVLGDDMDKALKGEISQVTHEFKLEELNPLWDLVNSALQRVPKSGSFNAKQENSMGAEDLAGPFTALGTFAKMGVVVCDAERRIVSMNPMFEDLSGVRADGVTGQEVSSTARDQAFAALLTDLLDRAHAGGEGVGEDFDFSGVSYRVHALAFGAMGTVKSYVLLAYRAGTNAE